MASLESGQSLGDGFVLLRPLGRGAMGEVWLVRDERRDEPVVAKLVPPGASPDAVALLERECRLLRKLDHPNIVRVLGFHRGVHDAFLTMAYVDGDDIGQLRGGPPAQIIERLIPVAEALEYAHSLGVVHRDVKASNVRCDKAGRPYLLDFGIAGVRDAEGLRLLGGGSRHSMSPQQLADEEPQPADDIYAFGALLYDLLTGHPPFWPNITEDRVRSATPEPLVSPHELPGRMQPLVKSLLAKSPADRPRSMRAVAEILLAARTELEPSPSLESPAAPPRSKSEIRLTPPPRVTSATAISPLTPGEPEGRPTAPRRRARRGLPRSTIVGLVALALLAVTVFVYLPRWAARQQVQSKGAPAGLEPEQSPVLPAPVREAASSTPKPPDNLQRADQALERVTRQREKLLAMGVTRWGTGEWGAVSGLVAAGQERLRSLDHAGAAQAFETAAERLDALSGQAPAALRQALDEGARALSTGDGEAAARAFEQARAIDPGNAAAARGLERARVADRVAALLDSGSERERSGRLQEAARDYQKAASLDPLSTTARVAAGRVRSAIAEQAFAAIMSDALSAVEREDPAAARAALERAEALRPGAQEVAEGRARLEQQLRLRAIAEHRRQSLALEAKEEWRAAAEQHAAVLALDATIAFAQEGQARCLARAGLHEQLEFHIGHPDRLSTDAVHAEASAILDRASEIEPAGPKLRRQIATLERLLRSAVTPIRVVLESDELTEVSVYKVGDLGTFRRRMLELRPGRYKVVGSRSGYRDVRYELVVVAGETQEPLLVRCEEEI